MRFAPCALAWARGLRWYSSECDQLNRSGTLQSADQRQANAVRALKKVSLFPFIFVMYSYTTAGPFGLEDQISTSGPGMALIYQLVIPFFWCIPMSLVSRCVRRLLGISCWVVELVRVVPVGCGVCRAVYRLSDVLLSPTKRDQALRGCPASDRFHHLRQCPWHSCGWWHRDSPLTWHPRRCFGDVYRQRAAMAPEPIPSCGAPA